MSSGGLFSFRPELGETPETLERRRKVAEAMLANVGGATTIGGGLADLGKAIGGRLALARANRGITAGQAGAADVFSRLFGGGGGGGSETAAPAGDVLAGGGGTDTLSGSGSGIPDVAVQEAYIRERAPTYGVDPDVAVKVARSEGLAPGVWQSNVMGKGGRETSYGPYQLLVGGGLGDEFQRTTGLDPSDPSTWKQNIDFSLGQAAKGGWSPWHGAAKVGVGPRTGIGGAPAVTAALAGTEPVASADPAALAAADMGGGDFKLTYANQNATRNQPVTGDLGSIYDQAARASGVTEVKVISGGQPATGSHRTGSHRHDHGNAGDIQLLVNGRPLDMTNPNDLPIIQKFIREASSRGAKGIGAGTDYMGSKTFHVGFGSPAVWGAGGKGANAPDWLRSAVVTGAGGGKGRGSSGRAPVSIGPGAARLVAANRGGGGLPAVMEALTGAGPRQQPVASADPAVLAATEMPLPYDPLSSANPGTPAPFRPAGGPTPYNPLAGGSANVGAPSPPLPPMRPAEAPVAPPVAPAAPAAPAAPSVAPVAAALGFDPLPQTSGLVGPVASAGHESLSPGAQAVTDALGGGGGTDALAGGGGGLLRRLFGGGGGGGPPAVAAAPRAAPAVAGGGGGVPSAAVPGETAALAGTEPVSGVPPTAGGLSPMAQRAIAVIQNPWSNDGQLAVAKAMLQQELEQATPQARATLEKTLLDIEQQRNPPQSRILTPEEAQERGLPADRRYQESPEGAITEVSGTKPERQVVDHFVIDSNTGAVVATIPDPGYRAATPEEAAKYGAAAGQFDLSNNKFEPINPPTGFSVTVDPDGRVSLVQGPGAGKLTEGQSKDTVYVTRAEGALPTLDKYGDALLSFPMQMAENDPTGFFRSMQSPEFQLAYGAGLEFLQAILRKDTAAAITPAETVEYGRVYLPEPGDGPERLEYKRQARRRAVEAIKAGLPPEAILRLEAASDVIKEKTGTTGEVIEVPSEADAVPAEPAASTGPPPTITDDAAGTKAYEALPSGAKYIGPDGKIRKKR